MKNAEVFEKMDANKAKIEFGCRYETVMMLLKRVPKNYDYEAIVIRYGDSPDDYIELFLRSCYMSTTIAVKNGKIVNCLDRWDKRNARFTYVVPVREILKDEHLMKTDDFRFFKERMK